MPNTNSNKTKLITNLRKTRFRLISSFLLSLFFLNACSNERIPAEAKTIPLVLSTTSLVNDLVKVIAQKKVETISLMGAGVDPHLYRATANDLRDIKKADLIFYNGLHLEGKMSEVLEKFARKKRVIPVTSKLAPQKLIAVSKTHDPHVWFHPELWIECGENVLREITRLLPTQASFFEQNYQQWVQDVRQVAQYAKQEIQKIPQNKRVLITSHDAFQYFAQYFSIQVEAVQGISTESEVGLKRLSELVSLIKSKKIPTIFVESSVSAKAIEKISQKSGAKIGHELYSDALGSSDSSAHNYLGMLKHNLKAIVTGLSNKNISFEKIGRL